MKKVCITTVCLTLLVAILGCSKPIPTITTNPTPTVNATLTPNATVTTTPTPTVFVPSVADAIAKAKPAVVRVITESGMGSGMIVDKAGYVLTNSHVVEGYQIATVMLSSGQKLPATILGRDEIADLAILKINGENLPVVTLGDSDKLGQGEEVVAIGYPLDLAGSTTITKGIVSALRTYDGVSYIQTDTAINPGNSGGALINLKGEVVGINVMSIRVASGKTIEGMNFAIAIDSAKQVIPKLIAGISVFKPTPTTLVITPSPTTEPAQWVTYTDSTYYGYSIRYPSTWTKHTALPPNSGWWLYLYDTKNTSTSPFVGISVPLGTTDTIDAYVTKYIYNTRSLALRYEILSSRNIMWQDLYPACEWTVLRQVNANYPPTRGKVLMLKAKGYMYVVQGFANESEYDSYSSTIDTIIANFRLSE